MNVQTTIAASATILLFMGCGDGGPGAANNSGAELPAGWESAEPVAEFSQSECGASNNSNGMPNNTTGTNNFEPDVPGDETVEFVAGTGEVEIHWRHWTACSSLVGFYKASESTVDVLVQPKFPSETPNNCSERCYEIAIGVSGLTAGYRTVNLFLRPSFWDSPPYDSSVAELVESGAVTVN